LPTIKRAMSTSQKLSVVATPQDADKEAATGQLTFVDSVVDSATDTIKLKATFANKDRRLWPGQFARVNLRLTTLSDATVVPSQAVQTGQDGQFIFVVRENSTVEQRPITIAQRLGEDVVIAKGVTPGETIVTEGQLRLENNTRVTTGDPAAGGRGGRGGRRGGEQAGGGGQPAPAGERGQAAAAPAAPAAAGDAAAKPAEGGGGERRGGEGRGGEGRRGEGNQEGQGRRGQ
jgi:multidrug efflux system membrane fusion protein